MKSSLIYNLFFFDNKKYIQKIRMTSENKEGTTCCFDSLLWRESKDNYSDPTEPQVRDNIYYPLFKRV